MARILSGKTLGPQGTTQPLSWEHEDASCMLIKKVCDDLNRKYEDFMTPLEVKLIQDLVKGESKNYT